MRQIPLPEGLPSASVLGLGCSRLGSMTADQTPAQARVLLAAARDLGVNVFDTANIYAQGRSERLIGETVGRAQDVCIVTKAGQVFPLKQRLLAPLRGPVSAILKRSKSAAAGLRAVRSHGLPRDYRPEALSEAIEQSLKRLRRDQVEIFLLHSPRREHLADGAALDAIQHIKQRGLARLVGVSCDDEDVLGMIAGDPRVEAIQAPFGLRRPTLEASLGVAARRGAVVIAREILSAEASAERPPPMDAVKFATHHAAVSLALLGTSNTAHLEDAVRAAE
ncbi:MAG: aldo/keto reductase [Pseudomonadota bacterium]